MMTLRLMAPMMMIAMIMMTMIMIFCTAAGTRFSKQRREARTGADKAAFAFASNEHKQGVFNDRAAGRRLMYLSEACTQQFSSYSPEHGVLYISLD